MTAWFVLNLNESLHPLLNWGYLGAGYHNLGVIREVEEGVFRMDQVSFILEGLCCSAVGGRVVEKIRNTRSFVDHRGTAEPS